MTAVADVSADHVDAGAGAADVGRAGPLRGHLPEVACLLAAAWWLIVVTRSWAGREPGPVSAGAVLVAIAVVIVRPDRLLPQRMLWLVTALSVGALIVPVTSPTGSSGAAAAAFYVCSGWLGVCCAAVVRRRPGAAAHLVTLVVLAALVEAAEAWLPWWGGADPAKPIVGTFYWHDPFAAFLLPGALLGLWGWLRGPRPVRLLALTGFVLGSVGVVYSTSRAALACYVAGSLVLLVAGVGARPRWRHAGRATLAVVVAAMATYAVAGPPFFPHRGTAVAGLQQRAAGQSLGRNGGYRLQFWHEALTVFSRHPWTGGGYHSMAAEATGHVPRTWALSPYAHNGYLQALSDGGLALALPFLLVCAAVVWAVLRQMSGALRRRPTDLVGFGLAVAAAASMAHSLVDFDWTYAANLALFAVVAGALVGRRTATRVATAASARHVGAGRLLVVVAVASLAVSGWAARAGDMHENLSPRAHVVQALPEIGR